MRIKCPVLAAFGTDKLSVNTYQEEIMASIARLDWGEKLVSFSLMGEVYGVPISMVQEIIRIQPITQIPRAPEYVDGVINLRGRIIPVIDLKKRFGLGCAEQTKNTRVVVVTVGTVTVGLVVDAVSEVLRLKDEDVEPPSPIVSSVDAEYIKGVGKIGDKLIILLDTEKILSHDEKIVLERLTNDGPSDKLRAA